MEIYKNWTLWRASMKKASTRRNTVTCCQENRMKAKRKSSQKATWKYLNFIAQKHFPKTTLKKGLLSCSILLQVSKNTTEKWNHQRTRIPTKSHWTWKSPPSFQTSLNPQQNTKQTHFTKANAKSTIPTKSAHFHQATVNESFLSRTLCSTSPKPQSTTHPTTTLHLNFLYLRIRNRGKTPTTFFKNHQTSKISHNHPTNPTVK